MKYNCVPLYFGRKENIADFYTHLYIIHSFHTHTRAGECAHMNRFFLFCP